MSATATSLFARQNVSSRAVNWSRFALIGPATALASVAANVLVYALGSTVVAYDAEFLPLATVGGTIVMTVAPALVAVGLYAALLRFTRRPARLFSIISAITLVVSLVPDFSYIPSVPGVTDAQIAILVLMHVVAASVIVAMLTSVRRSTWAS